MCSSDPLISEFFLREGPPFVVEPYVEELADGIDRQRGKQHSGGAGEDGFDGRHGPVAFSRYVQKPALTQQQEEKRSENADPYGPVGGFFPFAFG